MWRGILINFGFISYAFSLSLTDTFSLQNAPAALTNLATSASAYASGPSEPRSHIVNLRRKQQKADQLQSEKLVIADDALDGDLSIEVDNVAGGHGNEASPSLLQKKLGKILTKIRFISSLTSGASNRDGDDVDVKGIDVELSPTTTTKRNTKLDDPTDDSDNEITKTSEESSTERIQTFQKIIYPHSRYEAPVKVSFDLNERIANQPLTGEVTGESENIQEVGDMSKFGQIGVFFAELVGSVVGLLYGAAAQITNGSNGGRQFE